MAKEVLNYVIEKTHEMMNSSSCSSEAKNAGEAWLNALGTEREAEETKKYMAELEEDLLPIDSLISFAGSEQGVEVFGAETAKDVEIHGKEIKAKGAKYCDCEACAAVEKILEKKDELLKL